MKNKLPANLRVYIAGGAVVLLVIIFLVYRGGNKANEGNTNAVPQSQQPTVPPVVLPAPAGQVPESFPKELIMDGSAKVTLGDTVKYPDGRTQATAKFSSGKSMDNIFSAYSSYFKNGGWTIVKTVPAGKSRTIVARKDDTAAATVDMLQNGRNVDLFVNYVTR